MDKADLSGTQDKKIKDFEMGETNKSRVEKDYRGTYVPGQGFTGSGSARPGSLAHQSVDKESVQHVKDIISPMPKDPAGAQRQKMTQMQASPTTQKSKEKCIMASMMDKACADKGYPLGEGPKKTSGGGQLWMQHMPASKKETPRKIDLGTAPKLSKPTQKSAADKATPMEIPQATKGARLVPDVKPVEKGEKDDDMKTAKSILDEMITKAGPANDANEKGPVSGTPHGGSGPAQQSTGSMKHPNSGPAQMYVSGSAHAGKGPAQTSTTVNHPNRGPAQTCACVNYEGPGNDSQVSKAVTSMSVPRMPRALVAASVEQWRNAPKAGTRINTTGDMSGPLHGELIETVDEHEASPRNPIMKACPSCGRTYTLRKSTDACPTCSNLHRGNMTKSRGGLLIPATID